MSVLERHVGIIGGGIVGLTAAIRLLQCDPHVQVTVFEQHTVGSGASQYAGAIDIPYFQSEFHQDLVKFSWQWFAEYAPAVDYRLPVPIHWYLSSIEEEAELRRHVFEDAIAASTENTGWNAPDNINRLEGKAFVLHPAPWCQALKRQLELSKRAKVIEHCAINSLSVRNNAVFIGIDDGKSISADHVITAVGPWLPAGHLMFPGLTRTADVRNKRVYGLQIEVQSEHLPWCAIGWIGAGIFFLPYGKTKNYFMSVRHDEWDSTPDTPGTIAPEVEERAKIFLDQTVGPRHWRILAPSVFMDTYNTAFRPVIKSIADMGNAVTVITGTHGSGVRLSPALANIAAQICLGQA
jgi:glycine/D-amino acid oxidase-like deaminating enzyme